MTYTPAQSSPAGDYPHDVNPDLRSFRDEVKINTNLANRGVVSLAYAGREQENESSGVTRGNQHAAVDASYLVHPRLFAFVHLNYDGERTLDLSDECAGDPRQGRRMPHQERPDPLPCGGTRRPNAGAARSACASTPRSGANSCSGAATAPSTATR